MLSRPLTHKADTAVKKLSKNVMPPMFQAGSDTKKAPINAANGIENKINLLGIGRFSFCTLYIMILS